MHKMHGSMMDAAVPRTEDLSRAQKSLALPTLPWAPLAHGWAVHSATARVAQQNSVQALAAAAALPKLAFDVAAWQEGWALASAIGQQWMSLQSMWLEGLGEWAEEATELRHANTVSKLVDQEMNLLQQGLALAANQTIATARLGENVQANMAYWLSRKAQAMD